MSMSFLSLRSARLLLALAGIFGAIVMPPWFPFVAMVLLAIMAPAWEVLLIGVFVDLLWLPSIGSFSEVPIFTLAGVVLLWGLEPLRRRFLFQ